VGPHAGHPGPVDLVTVEPDADGADHHRPESVELAGEPAQQPGQPGQIGRELADTHNPPVGGRAGGRAQLLNHQIA